MPVQFLGEDDQTFTVDSGQGPQQVAKTPDMMAPGGIYDQAKAAQSVPAAPDAPMGISAPPPAPSIESPVAPAPSMQPPPPPPPTPTQIPMQSAQNDAPIVPAPMPQMQQQQQQMPSMMSMGTTGTTIGSNMVDPQLKASYLGATNAEANAIKNQGQIKGDLENSLVKNDQERAAVRDKQAGIETDKATMIAKQHQDFQTNIIDEYRKLADQKIQPKSIFEAGNVGQNIAAGLALGLGALGQALTGKENTGLAVIQAAIARDLEVQKQNIDNKRHSLNDLGVAYKAALDMGMSEKDAQLHATGYALDKVADQALQLGHASGSKMAVQNANQMAAAAQAARDETLMKATGTQVQRSTTSQDVRTPLPKLDPTEKKEINAYKDTDNDVQNMREFVTSAFGPPPTGPAANALRAIASKFNLQDANTAKLQMKMKEMFIEKNHEMFGSRITDPEVKQMADVMPSYADNPQVWLSKLDEIDRRNAEHYGTRFSNTNGQAEGFRYPELRSPYWEQYRGGGPTSNSTYTPAQQTTMNLPQTHHRK